MDFDVKKKSNNKLTLSSLKKEYFSRREYATIEAVEKDLYYYIGIFYNRKRLHSTLGYMSPVAYRIKNAGKKSA